MTENHFITDAVKSSLLNSDILNPLKNTVYGGMRTLHDPDTHAMKEKAQSMVESIQQLIGSAKLNDTDLQKLVTTLSRLQGALAGGIVSRETLATALSEAAAVIAAAEGSATGQTYEQKVEQLWQRIDIFNKDIDDDFEKMRKAGIAFDEKLWNKHHQLSQYLQTHPHDIEKQKQLDAVDDALLLQAEPQMAQHPNAQSPFDDAKKKSQQRHQAVDHVEAAAAKRATAINSTTDMDWETLPLPEKSDTADRRQFQDVTMNDVERQNVGQKTKITGKDLIG